MQALQFEMSWTRLALTKTLGFFSDRAFVGPLAPTRLVNLPPPKLVADDWLIIEPSLVGICGSDIMQVWLEGDIDSPMTALISLPHVLGHEVTGIVTQTGRAVRRVKEGDRVVINPWLTCAPRGQPLCDPCQRGWLPQCANFTTGHLPAGIHAGNNTVASGAFASRMPVHESQCFILPDGVSFEHGVLADPFSVSLHAVLQHPVPQGGTALVYGAGALGLMSIAGLRKLRPDVRIICVARYTHQATLATNFGADVVLQPASPLQLIEEVAKLCNADVLRPWRGKPMLRGGVDIIYDSVGSPETIEIGVRITKSRGKIVVTGVAPPRRFEWTPLYFKEISLVGSNAFGVEEFEGQRLHAMEVYLNLVQRGVDPRALITHRFPLQRWQDAFLTIARRKSTGALKVVFDFSNEATS